MSKDFKECLPLALNSTRTYSLPILRSQGTRIFSVTANKPDIVNSLVLLWKKEAL